MKTISSVVENYIKSKPFLLNALSQGIINLTSLARLITEELEAELGKDVKQGAIIMALKRLSEDLSFQVNHKITKVLREIGEITVRSSLNDYTYLVSDSIFQKQAELISELNKRQDVFFTSSRGVNETNIVVSDSVSELLDKYFKDEKLTQKLENLSSITVKLPKENTVTPGIYYFIFQRLAWEGIVIYEVISTSNEFTVLVDDNVVDKAFKIIKDLKLTK
ncbi:aspartate kinase [Flavobacterium oreochromis]|uniref:Aspartate kinase n=2 Tax=Flavobacterium TaxID=237 RepID=A0A246GAS3_9FLAO|nr:aspartate kinase [Flavobacterium oreochromis]OWP74466.1 aspartate kinase [Flavobacterium oreochromis]OWP77288.1 aspartate kinase [Flavobacterium oreochromis]POR22644.1 aspartate kinase [Flavobacterium columnare]QYS87384.1 aspartate kinase [Flavobacterium oreochromis]